MLIISSNLLLPASDFTGLILSTIAFARLSSIYKQIHTVYLCFHIEFFMYAANLGNERRDSILHAQGKLLRRHKIVYQLLEL